MSMVAEMLIAALVVLGSAFILLGSLGLVRLPDILTRLHAPTKATTLGVGALLLSSSLFFSNRSGTLLSLHELAILFFLFVSAPVTAQLIASAALHRRRPPTSGDQATQTEEISGRTEKSQGGFPTH